MTYYCYAGSSPVGSTRREKMKLPKELQDRLWAKEYLDMLHSMSDEDLFDEVFDAQAPDDYDGCFTTRGYWMRMLSQQCLRERFLSKGNK